MTANNPAARRFLYILRTLIIWVFVFIYLFPLIWTILLSFKTQVDALSYPPKFFSKLTAQNYYEVWNNSNFLQYCLNSIIIAVSATVIGLLLGTPAAYILSRRQYSPKGSKFLLFGVLSTRVVPQITFMIPFFIFFRRLRLIDTHISIIIMHLTIILGFGIWMMRSYFQDIPFELEESALIDGCSYFGAFRRIVLPLAGPGLATTAIFSFNYSWNEFLYALILTGIKTKTVPLGVYNWVSYEEINWGGLTATAVLALVPILIFYSIVQKGLVRGMTMGAVKG
ncbi:carbohydrate ABC transporter permease [Breznakiella homolactica]|uniref:Carbohydrate ABC transporter permease n=1 Tax=Breznakiella homolactica TaxID=2798577 RepID=A0A7T7XPL5_9SPIR|nr:carbohydrate ABC transporter permease [Breznakiella homolactica]QQO10170.1 carbohydrate ABC transporter permease [Breznakiella homolactica]